MANILVVDDDRAILDLIENILSKSGHFIMKIDNPEKVLSENLSCYHLIILNIMMPSIDGFQLCSKIRTQVDSPILFLTAKSDEADIIKGLGLGADDFLIKPIVVQELRARIDAQVRREQREKMNSVNIGNVRFSISSEDRKANWNDYSKGKMSRDLSNYIISIEREEDILIINYPLTMQYRNENLRRVLPNVEITMAFLLILELIVIIGLWSNRFAKKANSELKNLLIAMEKIEEQNLDFDVGTSNIEEVDIVLQGIFYIGKLIGSLKKQGKALGKITDINIIWNIDIEEDLYIKGYEHELERVLMNIIANAVDFSTNKSTIIINRVTDNSKLIIQVIDVGQLQLKFHHFKRIINQS